MHAATSRSSRHLPRQGRGRLGFAVAVSVLVHGLILSLQFGIPGLGLPMPDLPWKERRAHAVDLQVLLSNPPTSSTAPAERPVAAPDAPAPVTGPAAPKPPSGGLKIYRYESLFPPAAKPLPAAKTATKTGTKAKRPVARRRPLSRAKVEQPVIALNDRHPESFAVAPPALDEVEPLPVSPSDAPDMAVPNTFAEQPAPETEEPVAFVEPVEPVEPVDTPPPPQAEAVQEETDADVQQQAANDAAEAHRQAETLALQEQQAQQERQAAELEEARRRQEEQERLLAERQAMEAREAAQRLAEMQALQEQEEAARRALELQQQRRLEAERAARAEREAIALAAQRQAEEEARAREAELARRREAEELAEKARAQELAARRKAEAEAAAATAATSRKEPDPLLELGDNPSTTRGQSPGIATLPRNLTGGLAGKVLEQARHADLLRNDRSLGQLDKGSDKALRRSVFGSYDRDVSVKMYEESWRLKIERNGNLNYPRSAVDKAHGDPVVTVSIRSDGSIEDVIINRSSGRPELDEAVHRIARVNALYSAFPPDLARRFDVIEIRRVWNFDSSLRILEEVR